MFDVDGWEVVSSVRNPWGRVPLTDGGQVLAGGARAYMDRLLAQQHATDSESRRHHYVPKAYLREWSFDGKRVWTLDTVTGHVKPLGIADVCVKENFYRVTGPNGAPHNRVELMFGVVDTELRRVQRLLTSLEDPEGLEFDDLLGLCVSMALQRMRTLQERRLFVQRNRWLAAQNSDQNPVITDDTTDPHRIAGMHTEMLFKGMWDSADLLTTRQIELWHDPLGRFMTCDAPVFLPFRRNVRSSLLAAPYVIWPISPNRVVALSNNLVGEKVSIREAKGPLVGMVRQAVEQGRERLIFASEEQVDRLPKGKKFYRRAQSRLRCSGRSRAGENIFPTGCFVEWAVAFSADPDVVLCKGGLHTDAPEMWSHT